MTFVLGVRRLLGRFAHSLDTFGAEHFTYLTTLFHHQNLLQIWFELAVGGFLREGTRVPKGCGLSTMCAFSHVRETSFLAIIPNSKCPFTKAGHFIIENSLAQELIVSQSRTGEDIKSGKINNIHALDLAPTILAMLDQQIPSEMESKILPIFKD